MFSQKRKTHKKTKQGLMQSEQLQAHLQYTPGVSTTRCNVMIETWYNAELTVEYFF